MFARLSSYQGSPVPAEGDLTEKSGALVRPVEDLPGFRGAYYLVDRATGRAHSLTLWADEEAMRASEEYADRVREDAARREGQQILSVDRYEVAYGRVRP
jgi:heme-degrading monooxygenase HmoA